MRRDNKANLLTWSLRLPCKRHLASSITALLVPLSLRCHRFPVQETACNKAVQFASLAEVLWPSKLFPCRTHVTLLVPKKAELAVTRLSVGKNDHSGRGMALHRHRSVHT